MSEAEKQLASYYATYEPPMAKLGKAVRAKLRARLPGLTEIVYVYENQKSLVISYSPTAHGIHGVCSTALKPDGMFRYFTHGAELRKADPMKLLQGSAKTVRFVPLESAGDLDRAEIEALMSAALALAKVRLEPGAEGAVLVKAEEQKARAGKARTAKAAAPKRAGKKG